MLQKQVINMRALLLLFTFLFSNEITNFTPISKCVIFNNQEYKAIRAFSLNKKLVYEIVDFNSLRSGIIYQNSVIDSNCSQQERHSYYENLIKFNPNINHTLQNDGFKITSDGIAITTDLCPSSKEGFEERLYLGLIKKYQNPVPVTLFITKRWIDKHLEAFNKLKKWQSEGKLDITWGNHTALHIYHPKAPLKHNFVLSPEENLTKDILDLEVTLLKNGVTPSVFFRFPGLVSDTKSVQLVKKLNLIPIGSNTWLAKGEKIKNGSIILVHGNKNEPKGVDMLLKYIESYSGLKIKKLMPVKR